MQKREYLINWEVFTPNTGAAGMLRLRNGKCTIGRVESSLRKFYGRHHELVDRYGITVSQMISDMFLMSYYNPLPFHEFDLPN